MTKRMKLTIGSLLCVVLLMFTVGCGGGRREGKGPPTGKGKKEEGTSREIPDGPKIVFDFDRHATS